MEARLTEKEKELVAVAASVAAGCVPCTQYHMKAVQAAGAMPEEITRAVDAALAVKDDAKTIMARVAYAALGLPEEDDSADGADLTDRLTALASIAAAVAANSPPNFHRYVQAGRTAGVRDDEIRLAVALAQMIRAKAAEKMDDAAKGIFAAAAPARAQCGCGC